MAKRIIWSPNALEDRLDILEYWTERLGSKRYSRKVNKDFIALSNYLAEYPLMGKRFRLENERCFVKGVYLIVYQITDECIEILHVWDTRRDPESLMI